MNNNYVLLDGVIRQGLDLMRRGNNLQENQFRYWLEYSRNTLNMISNNPFLMTNYMNVIVAALRPGLETYQRYPIGNIVRICQHSANYISQWRICAS